MKKQKLTQTNPYIVTQKAYQSSNLGYSTITGTQFYEVKEGDGRYERTYKTAKPEDYENSIAKKAKVIKKIEYSGGYRVPLESLTKPYMKNKCWKSNDEEDDNIRYTDEQILMKLGLDIPAQDHIVSKQNKNQQQRSRSRSAGKKNDQIRKILVSQAEQKISELHQRREEINQRKIREEEMKKRASKLIVQDEETHQEVYVTVDNHKIKMIQAFVKQLELQEQLENIERLKKEKFYTQSNAKIKKALTLEDKMKIDLTTKEMNKELAYIELLKNHELYIVEREKIGQIAQVYFSLEKKDFDLNEFISPNTKRWGKQNVVSMSKNEINPFNHILFSRDAFILLVDRIVTELMEIEKRSEMFNSLNQSKDREIEQVSSEIILQFFQLRPDVSEIIGLKDDQIEKEFKLNEEYVSVQDIKKTIIQITNKEINKRNQIISAVEKQYFEKMAIIRQEFEKQERIKQLDQELEQVRKENDEQGIENLRNDEIERILDEEEQGIGGGYDSDPEALTLQQKTILISKQKRLLKQEILESRKVRCQSADKVRLTVPQPFKIEERENISKMKKSIRQTKLEEMIQEKQENDIKELNYVFKPKEIPEHIMEENEQRREIVRETSVQMTLENEMPFSFYYRDMDKEKVYKKPYWERQNYVFKANDVPKHVTMRLLEEMKQEQERKRKDRVEKRIEELTKISSLPPRMAKHEEEKREKLLYDEDEYDDEGNLIKIIPPEQKYFKHTFQPPKAKKITISILQIEKKIPNFDKLHKTFQKELDTKKAQFKSTKIKPFDFEESRKMPNRDYLDQGNILHKMTLDKLQEDKSVQIKKITQTQPDILPPSTKKSQEIIAYRKQQEEKKRKKEKEKQDELNAREKKREELKRKFYQSNALKNFDEEREKRKIEQQEEKSKEREYKRQVNKEFHDQIKQKLDERPLLVEKYDKDPSSIEKAIEKWQFKSGSGSKQSYRY